MALGRWLKYLAVCLAVGLCWQLAFEFDFSYLIAKHQLEDQPTPTTSRSLSLTPQEEGKPAEKITPQDIPKKPVVLAMATGYGWDALRNFVLSLYHTNFTTRGDIILFQREEDNDPVLRQRLARFGVKTEYLKTKHPYFLPGTQAHAYAAQQPAGTFLVEDMNRRFRIMQLWLHAHKDEYSHVFITDTREVLFQKDPFDWRAWNKELGDKLYVVIENPGMHMAGDWVNRDWIQSHFGSEGMAKLGDKQVSCSGTTYGSTDQMLFYFERMVAKLSEATENKITHGTRPDKKIYDQPIHNWLLYLLDWGDKLDKLMDGSSPVSSLAAHGSVRTVREPPRGMTVLNADGSVPCVVHQYDRHDAILAAWDSYFKKVDEETP